MLSYFIAMFESILGLSLIFLPMLIWSCDRYRITGFKLIDNLVWWLAALQSAALITLWANKFTLLPFLLVYSFLIAWITLIRAQIVEKSIYVNKPTFGHCFIIGLIIAGIIAPLTTYLEIPQKADALSYHLPMAAQWVQTHSLFADESRLWFYPGGYESLIAIFFTITGNMQLWFIPDLVAWALLIISSYRLLIALGSKETPSALFIGAIVLSSTFYKRLGWGGNDLWVAAFAVTMTEALLRSMLNNSRQARASGLLCIAILMCSKYAAFPWGIMLGIYFIFQKKKAYQHFSALEITTLIILLLLTLSFPIRNLLLTGNPIFPTGIGSFMAWGDTSQIVSIMHKITPQQLDMSRLVHQSFQVWIIFFRKIAEFSFLSILTLIFALIFNRLNIKKLKFHRSDWFVFAVFLLGFIMFINQPLVVENVPGTLGFIKQGSSLRFGLSWIMVFSLLFFSKIPKNLTTILATIFFLITLLSNKFFLFASITVFTSISLYCLSQFFKKNHGFIPNALCLEFVLIILIINTENSTPKFFKSMQDYHYNKKTRAIDLLPENAASQTIILSSALRALPLVGINFKNKVITVGMSLPFEAFKKQAMLHHASIIIVSQKASNKSSEEAQRMQSLMGNTWVIQYNDGEIIMLKKQSSF